MTTEELAADELLSKTRDAEKITTDELLALLAYASHGNDDPIFEVREEGAQVGSLGRGAGLLKKRAEEALR